MKKNKKIIMIVVASLLLVIIIVVSQLISDWYTFTSQDRKIKNYITSIEGVNKSKIVSDNYCSYSHQKYSKGALGCSIMYTFSVNDGSFAFNNNQISKELGWKYAFDNTSSTNQYSDKKYTKHIVFEAKSMTCSYSIINKEYQLGCSGPAKAEWFPVRED
jgi:hypothetical protein